MFTQRIKTSWVPAVALLLLIYYLLSSKKEESFKGPNLERFPISEVALSRPFDDFHNWIIKGNTLISPSEYIRLVSDMPNQRGSLFSTRQLDAMNMEILVKLSIKSEKFKFGDGMGIFLTEKPLRTGTCMGVEETFVGIGVIIDTFRNSPRGMSAPFITVLNGDGKRPYQKETDGRGLSIGVCPARQLMGKDVTLRIVYLREGYLRIDMNVDGSWNTCVQTQAKLPKNFYLGMSAENGVHHEQVQIHGLSVNRLGRVLISDLDNYLPVGAASSFSVLKVIWWVFAYGSLGVAIVVVVYIASVYLRVKRKKRRQASLSSLYEKPVVRTEPKWDSGFTPAMSRNFTPIGRHTVPQNNLFAQRSVSYGSPLNYMPPPRQTSGFVEQDIEPLHSKSDPYQHFTTAPRTAKKPYIFPPPQNVGYQHSNSYKPHLETSQRSYSYGNFQSTADFDDAMA